MSARRENVTPPDWFDRPLRWANLTLVQDDPGRYDPDYWLDLIRRARCDAASWNSGGIVAFYPTAIPYHRRNPAMGDNDPLGYLVGGCRRQGIVTTARVDHHATYPDAAAAHPEWLARNRDGSPIRHWTFPDLYVTCAFGPYNEGFMTAVMCEIMERYRVDGFNHNRWAGSRPCWCDSCRDGFRRFSGSDLPDNQDDPSDSLAVKHRQWKQQRLLELWDHWNAAIRRINPNAAVLPGFPGHLLRDFDLAALRERAHTLYLDQQGRSGTTPPWAAGLGGKRLRALLGGKPVGLTFSVGPETGYRWKDSVQTEAEMRIWALDGAAHGMHLKFCKFSGYLHDTRWPERIVRLYHQLAGVEPYLRNTRSLATVAVVSSSHNRRDYQPPAGKAEDAEMGVCQALIESRIPFDIVDAGWIEPADVDRYRLLILPNVAALSDSQCERLRAFVERGGSLLATMETSLFDETGTPRADFGLSDLFGVSTDGLRVGPMKNAYLRLEHETAHPVLAGLEDAARIVHGAFRLRVTAHTAFEAPPVTLIPPYPDLPMEEVYPREDRTGVPEVYLRDSGFGGRIAYVPWDIDRIFWETLQADHGRLLANLVRWTLAGAAPVEIDGPGVLDVAVWRQRASMTVNVVNLTNPMLMRGAFREFYPVGPLNVRVRLPAEATVRAVRLPWSGEAPEWRIGDGWLETTIPRVEDFAMIAIDLEGDDDAA